MEWVVCPWKGLFKGLFQNQSVEVGEFTTLNHGMQPRRYREGILSAEKNLTRGLCLPPPLMETVNFAPCIWQSPLVGPGSTPGPWGRPMTRTYIFDQYSFQFDDTHMLRIETRPFRRRLCPRPCRLSRLAYVSDFVCILTGMANWNKLTWKSQIKAPISLSCAH